MHIVFLSVILIAAAIIVRLSVVLRKKAPSRRTSHRTKPCHLAVFLGSGGHTSEALALLSAIDFDRYSPRTYIISQGDSLSAKKAFTLESVKTAEYTSHPPRGTASNVPYTLLTIPRARRVHQTLLTTPITAVLSLTVCLYHVTLVPLFSGRIFADVLILNGPGTCCMLCAAVYCNRFLGIPSPKLIYVESFARVRTLSLSGKILRPFVDRFIVQWPDLLNDSGKGDYRGWLV